jgi:2-iminoacetate synthase ThiH
MTTSSTFDLLIERVTAGERLAAPEVAELAAAPDILPLGMLADAVRRRLHGTRVTYLRVTSCAFDQSFADAIPPAAREVRITGTPGTLNVAVTAVESAKAVAGDRTVSGFGWGDIGRLASAGGVPVSRALETLRGAGLDALADVPLDAVADAARVVESLVGAGFRQLRLTIEKAPAADRRALIERAAVLQEQYGGIQAINPLPALLAPHRAGVRGGDPALHAFRPTTGYEDVKAVAIARLAAPNIPTVQVDWLRYGPKLAQVALTFGADDLDAVPATDDAPEGRRRAPLEEVRRNIEAAGFSPAERDGRFNAIA